MTCTCIRDFNNKLREHNACLVTTLFASPERVACATEKVDSKKRGRPPIAIASYCPFCGEKYVSAPKSEAVS